MEIRHLRYFIAVAEELHFTRAAAKLETAQPALSQQIRRLERELGAQLFNRTNRSVELTHVGEVFLDHARRVVVAADRAKRAAERAGQGEVGSLAIGYLARPAAAMLPELMAAYRAQHPHVEIELRELQNLEQVDSLISGAIDVAIMTRRVDDSRLRAVLLQRHRLVVALPATHRLANRSSLRLRELKNEHWIHPIAHSGPLLTACAKAGFEPLITQHATDYTTRMTLVASGLGVAVDVESEPRLPSRHIVYRPLTQPKITIDLVAAWREDRRSSLVDGLLEIARSVRKSSGSESRGGDLSLE